MLKTAALGVGLLCSLILLENHLTSAIKPKPKTVCPSFFISLDGHCYHFSEYSVKGRDQALKQCLAMDTRAILVNIESVREWQTIKDFLKDNGLSTQYWWTGGSNRLNLGEWLWMGTNEPVYYNNWCQWESTTDSSRRCLYLHPYGNDGPCWRTMNCNNKVYNTYFICEVEPLK